MSKLLQGLSMNGIVDSLVNTHDLRMETAVTRKSKQRTVRSMQNLHPKQKQYRWCKTKYNA